jgi:tRNA(fMet)-specific endonuclease VapC
MERTLIDTDTLSAIMRQNTDALANAQAYIAVHKVLTISLITRYEILRGLKAKQATTQQAAFEQFCASNIVIPLTDPTILRGSEIYADLHRRGLLIGDADILIAATAIEHGLVLVTNNTSHFSRIPDLHVQNWLDR